MEKINQNEKLIENYYEFLGVKDYIELASIYVPGYKEILLPDIISHTVEHIKENNSKVLYDIGSGPGHVAREIAQECPSISEVICIDTDKGMLAQAEQIFETNNPYIFKAVKASALHLQSIDSEGLRNPDVIISNMLAHNFSDEDKIRWVQDVYEKLNFGGLFMFGDFCTFSDKEQFFAEMEKRKKHALKHGAQEPFFTQSFEKELHEDNPWTPENMMSVLDAAGFKDVGITKTHSTFVNIRCTK